MKIEDWILIGILLIVIGVGCKLTIPDILEKGPSVIKTLRRP